MLVTLAWLRELARASRTPEAVGGKARHLALLCAVGLPVPDGFVLLASALRAARNGSGSGSLRADSPLMTEARAAAARLGPRLAVRSSSPAEDRMEGAAPGLFSSQLDVEPDDLVRAVGDVLRSAEGPAVRAYLEKHRLAADAMDLSVIVQQQVGGGAGARGVLYTRPPGQPTGDEVWVEAAGLRGLASTAIARRRDGAALERDPDFPLGAEALAELVRLGLAAEQAIAAGGRDAAGADVEWVEERGRLWLVQARPIRKQPATARRAAQRGGEELAFSRGDTDTVWYWDASHNPDPLSPAQIGLVDWVSAIAPSPLRVVDGYLYVGSRGSKRAEPASPPTAAEVQAIFDEVEDTIRRALAPVEGAEPPDLDDALAAYRAVYQAYMVRLTPVLDRGRAALRQQGAARDPSRESAVARAARSGDREALAALAPVWDVAAPTFGEPGYSLELDRATRAAIMADRGDELAGGPRSVRDLAGTVRAISEEDDLLFFRAQRAVRRALLGLARIWNLEPADDIFYLPFDQVRAHAGRGTMPDRDEARQWAREARDARDAQRERAAPLAFRDGRPIRVAAAAGGLDFWRGRSAGGGTARGRVLRVDDLGHLGGDPRDRIVVTQSITPAALLQLAGAAALVCEQGGVLDHAAALARELGLPCVVGCRGAWHTLCTGDEALVDGDAGLVVRLLAIGGRETT